MASISDLLARVIQLRQSRELGQAAELCRRIIEADPRVGDAWHLLGRCHYDLGMFADAATALSRAFELQPHVPMIARYLGLSYRSLGQLEAAVRCYQRALQLKPDYLEVLLSLGNVLQEKREWAHAEASYRRCLELNPRHVETHNNLGSLLEKKGDLAAAIGCYQRALELRLDFDLARRNLERVKQFQHGPAYTPAGVTTESKSRDEQAESSNQEGNRFQELGKWDEAEACFRRAIDLKPEFAEAHSNLGNVLQTQGHFLESLECYRRAIKWMPNFADAHANLGAALRALGRWDEAITACRRALELKPDFTEVHYNLGLTHKDLGQWDEAIACYQRALELNPQHADAHNNLGTIFTLRGKLEEAANCFRQALKLQQKARYHSNLLFCQVYNPRISPKESYEEHLRWAERFGKPVQDRRPHLHDVSARTKLKVGYISADFRRHAVACFCEPIFRAHDRSRIEVHCFANQIVSDETTRLLQQHADHWHWVARLGDDALEQQIRALQIDILIDLSGHTAGNRLPVLARKPAPVQVTWLGYPATTGLAAIDYRLTDEVLNPSWESTYHAEQLYYLPCGSATFAPLAYCPDVGDLPAKHSGSLTFGAPHNLAKMNDAVFDVWSRVLLAVPDARLAWFREGMEGEVAARIRKEFTARGVEEQRLALTNVSVAKEGYEGYMAKYGEVDICLDTFPANAGTTGCEALYMGVPWLTLYGDRFFGRQTATVLTRLGLQDWICRTPDEWVEKAIYWSQHLNELAELRHSLRSRFLASPLGNATLYTRHLEDAYFEMWNRYRLGIRGPAT